MGNKRYWSLVYFLLFTVHYSLFTVFGCGYQLIGSKSLPFDSITIKPVHNTTYEPRLEEKLHSALSKEFLQQGFKVMVTGGNVELESTITSFELGSIATINERVQEQQIIMRVNAKLIDKNRVTEFPSIESPIKITFQTSGSVSESVAEKEKAATKACNEVAREIIGKIIIKYAE